MATRVGGPRNEIITVPKKILLECFNLALPKGTGIKTYALTLAKIARSLGYDIDALLQTNSHLSTKDPLLAEIAFHEGVARSNWRDKFVRNPLEIALGKPFGIETRALPNSGFVAHSEPSQAQHLFSRQLAAYRFTTAARRHFWRHRELATLRLDAPPDLFHATHPVPIRVKGCPNIYTVHDVIPMRLPRATLDNKKYFLNSLRAICASADHIVTVSECSKRDILTLIDMPEDKISVTYQSVAFPPDLLARSQDDTAAILHNVYGLEPQGYFLYFGALEPKKNVSRLIDAYAASGSAAPLVIAGGLGWSYEAEVEQMKQDKFSSWRIAQDRIHRERKVRHLDHPPLSHLVALIRGARAVLFPSLYEGFGLPVLEAMMLGAPVMTSNLSSLPEVAGEATLMVDPYDLDSMTQAIKALDHDADLRADLVARGLEQAKKFTPEIYSERVSTLYRKLLGDDVRRVATG